MAIMKTKEKEMVEETKETKKTKRARGPVGPLLRYVKLSIKDGNGVPVENATVTIEEILSDSKEAFKRRNEGFIEVSLPRRPSNKA